MMPLRADRPACHSIPRIVLVVVALLTAPQAMLAAELSAEAKAAIDATIGELMEKQNVPGLSAAIVVDGQLAYERGYGQADIENNVPATPETVYRLASISKMLTAAAALQLAEQGKLDLKAPIQKYVPSFPEKQAPITAELLLKHQSGIRHYRGTEGRSAVSYNGVGDALVIFRDDPLLFAPGEKMSYTTYGFNLLGTAIEGASGDNYVSYVTKHVFEPAGIKTIQADSPYKIIPHRAAGYRQQYVGKKDSLRNDYMVDISNKIPGGGWCGTPGDLCRFATALMDGKLLRPDTLTRMWTAQTTSDGKPTNSGLGGFIEAADGKRRISHSGGQSKVSTFLVFCPEDRTAVALMCNLSGTRLNLLANKLLDQLAQPVAAAP